MGIFFRRYTGPFPKLSATDVKAVEKALSHVDFFPVRIIFEAKLNFKT